MGKRKTKAWFAGVIAGIAWIGGTGRENLRGVEPSIFRPDPPDSGLIFRLHDYAHLSASTLRRMEAEASKVLATAGIRSRWEAPVGDEPPSRGEEAAGPSVLVIDVNILSEQMASQVKLPDAALGYAAPSSATGSPKRVSVVYDHALQLGPISPASLDQLLGYAILHEVGHVLLPSAPHSASGIMRAEWDLEDLWRISQGRLYFNAQQSAAMRAEVAAHHDGP